MFRYWLSGEKDDYKWTIVELLQQCPVCKQTVIEYQHVDWRNRKFPRHRAKQSDHGYWLDRIASHLVCDESAEDETQKEEKKRIDKGLAPASSKGAVIVSEATMRMSRSTESVFQWLLRKVRELEFKTQPGDGAWGRGKRKHDSH